VPFKNPDQGNNKKNQKCHQSDRLTLFYLTNQHGFGGIINAGNIGERYYLPPRHSNPLINRSLMTLGLEVQDLYLVLYISIYIELQHLITLKKLFQKNYFHLKPVSMNRL